MPAHLPAENVVLWPGNASPSGDQLVARRLDDALGSRQTDEAVLPDFCAEGDLPQLRQKVRDALAKGIRRIRVTSLYGYDLIPPDAGITITTSFPLPACNVPAVTELQALGAAKVQAWLELDSATVSRLVDSFGAEIEIFRYGRIPVLSTRFALPAHGRITDGRGATFDAVVENGETHLLPEKALRLPDVAGASSFIDLSHADPDETDTTDLNYSRDLV